MKEIQVKCLYYMHFQLHNDYLAQAIQQKPSYIKQNQNYIETCLKHIMLTYVLHTYCQDRNVNILSYVINIIIYA